MESIDDWLPPELIQKIFCYITLIDRMSILTRVSKKWRRIVYNTLSQERKICLYNHRYPWLIFSLFGYFTQVREIAFNNYMTLHITRRLLYQFSRLKYLTKIDFSYTDITGKIFDWLELRTLKELNLAHVTIQENSFYNLIAAGLHLQKLNLTASPHKLDPQRLQGSLSTDIIKLKLDYSATKGEQLFTIGIAKLFQLLRLSVRNLIYEEKITPKTLEAIVSNHVNLVEFVSDERITRSNPTILARLEKLQALSLEGVYSLRTPMWRTFGSSLSDLTYLNLGNCLLTDGELVDLGKLQGLKYLNLQKNFLTSMNWMIKSVMIEQRDLPYRLLDLSLNFKLTEEAYDNIVIACPNIVKIFAGGCRQPSENWVKKIRKRGHSVIIAGLYGWPPWENELIHLAIPDKETRPEYLL